MRRPRVTRRFSIDRERTSMAMHEIDYLHGDDMQFVEIEPPIGEAAIGEAGSMMYMEDGIEMDTIFGDGSDKHSGVFGKLVAANV